MSRPSTRAFAFVAAMLALSCTHPEYEQTFSTISSVCIYGRAADRNDAHGVQVTLSGSSDDLVEIVEESCEVDVYASGSVSVRASSTRIMRSDRDDGPVGYVHVDCPDLEGFEPGDYTIYAGGTRGVITLPLEPETSWCSE